MIPAGDDWPPSFTIDQEAILNLLTGDRFYSDPSAALREAVLNAIDAVHRRRRTDSAIAAEIRVVFDKDALELRVDDNGVGMSSTDITALFAKVGASAARTEATKESVGEFGIGVISYFMAADEFALDTWDGTAPPVALKFPRAMLAGSTAEVLVSKRVGQGTTVILRIRSREVFDLLLKSFAHWCRDVDGLVGRLLPENVPVEQGDANRAEAVVMVDHPSWIERVHIAPVADPTGWDAMTGKSEVSVLYRGVFVQKFEVKGLWGIEGSVDVDPKHFKPRLNREGFIAGQFEAEVKQFLRDVHPVVIEAMASRLADAIGAGKLDRWNQKRWANLWLSVPREASYANAVSAWDTIFRSLPVFEVAEGNRWVPASLNDLLGKDGPMYVAPLADEQVPDIVKAALRLLRSSGGVVIRGIRKDNSWMRYAASAFGTTADLITSVFASELPALTPIVSQAETILAQVRIVARMYTGSPSVDVVLLGSESPPALKLQERLVINVENPAGWRIVHDALRMNTGPTALISLAARHAYEQMGQVAAVIKDMEESEQVLSPMRREFIRKHLP